MGIEPTAVHWLTIPNPGVTSREDALLRLPQN